MGQRPIPTLLLGDLVELRRPHACGGSAWRIDRLGADIGLRCARCGRHVMLERRSLESRLTVFLERGDPAMTAAARPEPTATA
ncbi:MAG: DUF951 domain-containing protein [Chloroflexota bacterium]